MLNETGSDSDPRKRQHALSSDQATDQGTDQAREVFEEFRGALPGRHERTSLELPQDFEFEDSLATGQFQQMHPLKFRYWVIGITSWIAWFGIGLYSWWFTDTTMVEYVIATIGWLVVFAFTLAGIPLVRWLNKTRHRQ